MPSDVLELIFHLQHFSHYLSHCYQSKMVSGDHYFETLVSHHHTTWHNNNNNPENHELYPHCLETSNHTLSI
jgi:hypothetical protein